MSSPRILYPLGAKNDVLSAFPGGSTYTVNVGDLLYWDSGNTRATPASSLADKGGNVKNQRFFGRNFIGVAGETKITTDTSTVAPTLQVWQQVDAEFDCASATFEVGDWVTATANGTSDGLLSTSVAATTDADAAIGYVIKREATAVTRVQVRLVSRFVAPSSPHGGHQPLLGLAKATTTSANVVLDLADSQFQVITNGAAINLTMPAEASTAGKLYLIVNKSAGAYAITVKASDGTTTVVAITQGLSALIVSDGTTYRSLLSA